MRIAFRSSIRAVPPCASAYALVAASPSSSVSTAGPTTRSSKNPFAASSSGTISTTPASTSALRPSPALRPKSRPVSSSSGITATTTMRLGSADITAAAARVATRLMMVLESATSNAAGSVNAVDDRIVCSSLQLAVSQDFAQFDAVDLKQSGELAFAQEALSYGFGGKQVESQSGRPVGIGLLRIGRRQAPQHLPRLRVGDSAIRLEPIPRTWLDETKLLKPTNHCLARNPKEMSQHDNVTTGHSIGAGRNLLELLHHAPRRR